MPPSIRLSAFLVAPIKEIRDSLLQIQKHLHSCRTLSCRSPGNRRHRNHGQKQQTQTQGKNIYTHTPTNTHTYAYIFIYIYTHAEGGLGQYSAAKLARTGDSPTLSSLRRRSTADVTSLSTMNMVAERKWTTCCSLPGLLNRGDSSRPI
jgi:hypothetical protein